MTEPTPLSADRAAMLAALNSFEPIDYDRASVDELVDKMCAAYDAARATVPAIHNHGGNEYDPPCPVCASTGDDLAEKIDREFR